VPQAHAARAPVVERARLSPVDEADDARGESCAAVRLHAGRVELGIAPPLRQHLLLPARRCRRSASAPRSATWAGPARARGSASAGIWRRTRIRWCGLTAGHGEAAAADLDNHRDGTGRVGRRGERRLNVHGDLRIGRVVDAAEEPSGRHGHLAIPLVGRAHDVPGHTGHVLRRSPVNLPLKLLEELGTAPVSPDRGARHLPAVPERQRIRQVRIRIGRRLVIGCGAGADRSGRDRRDLQQIHDPLAFPLVGDLDGRRLGGWRLCAARLDRHESDRQDEEPR
jgi:hypothetical protein